MEWHQTDDVVILGLGNIELPSIRGLRSGLFTIHFKQSNGRWVLSANGVKLIETKKDLDAKKAAHEFALTGVDWNLGYEYLRNLFETDFLVRQTLVEIRDKYK